MMTRMQTASARVKTEDLVEKLIEENKEALHILAEY